MDLTKINLTNFRNFNSKTQVELPRASLLVAAAPNAVGKTNFLESVAVLLRGKTWRARTRECTKWGEEGFLLEGEVERQGSDDSRIAVRYHQPTKKLRIEENGLPASLVSFYTNYPFVALVPEDTFLLSRGPAQRRNLINHVLVSHPGYISALVQYYRVLKQRNTALKKANNYQDLSVWTELLSEHALAVWRHREELVSYWNEKVNNMYFRLSGEKRSFEVGLALGVKDRNDFIGEINKSWSYEKRYGYTLYGPHRDDVVVLTDQKPVTTTLSRGQLKSLVVSLKVLSYRYMHQVTKEKPILLLDDVLSELDEERQVALIDNLPKTQTILTCTKFPETLRNKAGVYLLDLRSIVEGGNIGESEEAGDGQGERGEFSKSEEMFVERDEERVALRAG